MLNIFPKPPIDPLAKKWKLYRVIDSDQSLENPMDRGAWWAAIHGVAKSQTWLHFHFSLSCIGEGDGNPLQCYCLENPGIGEPGRLPSMGSHRVGHDWSHLAAVAAASYAECRRIDAFELWYWRRLLRFPWTARRSSQSIVKEISPGYSLEGMMLKLKLQYFGHLMQRVDSLERLWCWEGLRAGEGDDRGWDGWMASLTWWTWVWVNSGSWWWTGRPGVLWFMGSQRVGHDWATELNWTE